MKNITSAGRWFGAVRRTCLSGIILCVFLFAGEIFAAPQQPDGSASRQSDASPSKEDKSSTPQQIDSPTPQPPDNSNPVTYSSDDSTGKDLNKNLGIVVSTKGGFRRGLSRTSFLLGNMWGVRSALNRYGMSLIFLETSEVLGNPAGGIRQGTEYDGLTQMILQLDTQRAFHWYGGTINASALQIHGSNLSALNLSSLQTASGIESNRATRLWELWYDQRFDEQGKFDIKIGQQSLDQEFMVSQNALLFVNTMFGWPMVPSADMPGGGPAYPLSTLGIRARVRPANPLNVLVGVFNGRPSSLLDGDAQENNSSGTNFALNGGALVIAELQYVYPSLGSMVYAGKKPKLSRTYKLGAWYNTEKFADQRYDKNGLPLADPTSAGDPRLHRGDFSIYGVADQMFWKDPSDDDRSLNFFVRAMGTPQVNRNLVDFSLNAGVTFNEPIRHRDDDTFGVGMGYAHVSSAAAGFDKDYARYVDPLNPARSGETFVEVTYSYQRTPWWIWQPTFQYVFNPGGGILNPNSPSGQKVKGEPVLGVRFNFAF